jgi:hypothetical protein
MHGNAFDALVRRNHTQDRALPSSSGKGVVSRLPGFAQE